MAALHTGTEDMVVSIVSDIAVFQVTSMRPESRVLVRVDHAAELTTRVNVSLCAVVCTSLFLGRSSSSATAWTRTDPWTSLARVEFMYRSVQSCFRWHAIGKRSVIKLRPGGAIDDSESYSLPAIAGASASVLPQRASASSSLVGPVDPNDTGVFARGGPAHGPHSRA